MANVYIVTTNEAALAGHWWTNFRRLNQSALACKVPIHNLVDRPENADVILFTDSTSISQSDIRNHDLMKKFSDRIFVYSENDCQLPLIPGIYASTEKRWYLPSHMRSGFYVKVIDHEWIHASPIERKPRYLFSFCGSFDTHPTRRHIGEVKSSQGFVRDTSTDEGRSFGKSADIYQQWHAEYAEIMRDSMFILCPRGVSPSSYRIFEAMRAGRVPVIIADDWVAPAGPDWMDFSLRVPEAQLHTIPQILEPLIDRAPQMGVRAAEAWERWFSKEQAFQTVVTWCLEIMEARRNQSLFQRYSPLLQLARPYHFRHVVLGTVKRSAYRRLIQGNLS